MKRLQSALSNGRTVAAEVVAAARNGGFNRHKLYGDDIELGAEVGAALRPRECGRRPTWLEVFLTFPQQ